LVGGFSRRRLIGLRTSVDAIVTLSDEHPLQLVCDSQSCEARPYVRFERRLEERLTRFVYYELIALGMGAESEGRRCLGIWSSGRSFPLG
jgi:uncharacterized protein